MCSAHTYNQTCMTTTNTVHNIPLEALHLNLTFLVLRLNLTVLVLHLNQTLAVLHLNPTLAFSESFREEQSPVEEMEEI
uniref:Uncharacterized protein n=1 Tax=Tanacetum cinerariifolium TaxID=118510 RepID=A0A699S3Z8_TANCI|nr:hypothetical protein [Tanacetum cinerariifolium]